MAADTTTELFGYWRSSSSYRIRIALNLKQIDYAYRPVHLVKDGGEQKRPEFREINPLGLVPVLRHRGQTITQSMAICEYLEEVFPERPLLPPDAESRARVRAIAMSITSEIQPLNNVAVLKYLGEHFGQDQDGLNRWMAEWIYRGFTAVERWLQDSQSGRFCHGDEPGLADCFLVPQVYNAARFETDLQPFPRIREINERALQLPEFEKAVPENQPDAP